MEARLRIRLAAVSLSPDQLADADGHRCRSGPVPGAPAGRAHPYREPRPGLLLAVIADRALHQRLSLLERRHRPRDYEWLLLVHIYAADLILVLVPFTKLSHCILSLLSQTVTAVAWKFPAGAGDRVAATLGYADRPNWIKDARLTLPDLDPVTEVQKP